MEVPAHPPYTPTVNEYKAMPRERKVWSANVSVSPSVCPPFSRLLSLSLSFSSSCSTLAFSMSLFHAVSPSPFPSLCLAQSLPLFPSPSPSPSISLFLPLSPPISRCVCVSRSLVLWVTLSPHQYRADRVHASRLKGSRAGRGSPPRYLATRCTYRLVLPAAARGAGRAPATSRPGYRYQLLLRKHVHARPSIRFRLRVYTCDPPPTWGVHA